jgi:epoxyqueuosine reductase
MAPLLIDPAGIKKQAKEIGFHLVGIATIDPKLVQQTADRLDQWLSQGYHAEMKWMTNPRRRDPCEILPTAKSIIAVALNYYQPDARPPGAAKISRYAWGKDYHQVCTKKLKALHQWLQAIYPDNQFRYYTDTGPIGDKVWAEAAGLGWIGKNGNLITRKYGSWVFLGEIITDLEISSDRTHQEHCGTCTRCLTACPTQAIVSPFVVDAGSCIAYHTIENRAEKLPESIEQNLQGWVAGCDICQDVCPWNQQFAQATDVEEFAVDARRVNGSLADLAVMSDEEYQEQFRGSALKRIKPYMFRRNARANLSNDPDNQNYRVRMQ